MNQINGISVSELNKLIGTPNCPTIIDVRIDEDFDDDPRLIPTAIRISFNDVESIQQLVQSNSCVIVYCQKGLKLSQGVVAVLHNKGIKAKYLVGGQFAWRDNSLPMIAHNKIPSRNNKNQTLWVLQERPNIKTIASAWMIIRYIDPRAMFLFICSTQVDNVSQKFDATKLESLDVEIKKFNLINELKSFAYAFSKLNKDGKVNSSFIELSKIYSGLSKIYENDLVLLKFSMPIFDALYFNTKLDQKDTL